MQTQRRNTPRHIRKTFQVVNVSDLLECFDPLQVCDLKKIKMDCRVGFQPPRNDEICNLYNKENPLITPNYACWK